MLNLLINKKYYIILGVTVAILLFYFIFIFNIINGQKGPSNEEIAAKISITPVPTKIIPTPSLARQPNLSLVVPGKTTKNEVIERLGQPTRTDYYQEYTVYMYDLPPTKRQNAIYMSNDTVKFISEEVPVDNKIYDDYLKSENSSAPDGILYDQFSGAGFDWLVYSERGVAFLTNQSNGYTIKVLYFERINYDNFLASAASTFSLKTDKYENIEQF